MFNCSKHLLAYHHDQVRLSRDELDKIRAKRDIVRNKIISGLNKTGNPLPIEFVPQGSYAMRTLVWDDHHDYDIDDGIYFDRAHMVGLRGAEVTSLVARKIVLDAAYKESFRNPPQCLKNCIRIFYREGFRVDVPVYRTALIVGKDGEKQRQSELASSIWKRSDARDVTKWFESQCKAKSPSTGDGYQLRRICRLVKKFTKSKKSWKGKIACGFAVTKLVADCYEPIPFRDDESLFRTLMRMYQKLSLDTRIYHPVTLDETITKTMADNDVVFLKEKIFAVLMKLEKLFLPECSEKTAMKTWNHVFNTQYFYV